MLLASQMPLKVSGTNLPKICRTKLKLAIQQVIVWSTKVKPHRVVLSSDNGKTYACNPLYLSRALLSVDSSIEIVWLAKDRLEGQIPNSVKITGRCKFVEWWYLATAQIWVSNSLLPFSSFPKKPQQCYVQTFHGSYGLKKIGYDAQPALNNFVAERLRFVKFAQEVDVVLADSDIEKLRFERAYGLPSSKVLLTGHPRLDPLWTARPTPKTRSNPRPVAQEKILLLAPTFGRANWAIHVDTLLESMSHKFGGEWKLMVREHLRDKNGTQPSLFQALKIQNPLKVVDGRVAGDSTALLLNVDAVLTDFSSIAFDYLWLHKPTFLLIERDMLLNWDRWFYHSLDQMPMPVSSNLESLLQEIDNFDARAFADKVAEFLLFCGTLEDGESSERAARKILGLIQQRRTLKGAS